MYVAGATFALPSIVRKKRGLIGQGANIRTYLRMKAACCNSNVSELLVSPLALPFSA
jgi:hypothetical protein